MNKENLKQELTRHSVNFANGGINCEGLTLPLMKYIIDNFDDTPTTEQAWEKIAEKFEEGPKELCATLVSALPPYNLSEKPEIPKKLAEMIEELKEAGFGDEYILFDIYADKEDGVMDNDVERWIGKNEGYLIKAVTNGYTIEKFIVKAPYDRYFGGFLEKGQHAEINFSHINRDNAQKFEDKSKAVAVATLVDGEVEEV